jgi:acyl-CoA synthetase (NDP forming)
VLASMVDDSDCGAIALYLEGVSDGRRFAEVLHSVRNRGIPIVVFKTGTSEAGRAAISSHSGVLAGNDKAYDAVFREEGVVRVAKVTQLLSFAHVLAHQPLRRGENIAVMSTSGGGCGIAVDQIAHLGLKLARFEPRTNERLESTLPSFAPSGNPVDMTGQGAFIPDAFRKVLSALLDDRSVDAVVIVITSIADPDAERVATEILEAIDKRKPVTVAWLLADSLARRGRRLLTKGGVTVFDDPADALEALKVIPQNNLNQLTRRKDIDRKSYPRG